MMLDTRHKFNRAGKAAASASSAPHVRIDGTWNARPTVMEKECINVLPGPEGVIKVGFT